MLSFFQGQEIIKKYKLPVPSQKLISSLKEAEAFARNKGYPLVLKVISSKLIHKSEFKAVIVDIRNEFELRKAWKELEKIIDRKTVRENLEGILVQKFISGKEVIIGGKQDQIFGPVLMFGLGGIFTEVYKDVVFRLAPIKKREIKRMIQSIKGYPILEGVRGEPKVNFREIEDVIIKASDLIVNEDIKEFDFNPVIVNEKRALIVDVKFISC